MASIIIALVRCYGQFCRRGHQGDVRGKTSNASTTAS